MCNLSMQQCNLYCYCNVGTNRMQSDESLLSKAMLRCSLTSLLQCQCKPNAELENSFLKAMLRCSLTSLLQRYNAHTPKSKFFRRLISHHECFPHPKIGIEPFIYGHFRAFSTREKKMKSGYNFLSHADYQNVRSSNAMPHLNATIPHLFTTAPRFTQNSTEQ